MKISLIILISLIYTSLLMGEGSAQILYEKRCAACHGLNAQKKALNSSKILNTLSEEEIISALMGYKNGTYGGKLKSVKRGLITALSENDINSIATYIQTIKQQ